MDKAKRKIFEAIGRPLGANTSGKVNVVVQENLTSKHLRLSKMVRHGFPDDPRCMSYDPVQKLLAIGQGNGCIRILGKPGVDVLLEHESSAAVFSLQFLVNEGALLSACKDDTVHLWNLRQKRPEIVHSLQFQREPVTCVHLPLESQWFYIGTDRGNVHVASVKDFQLSGYVINWNKAIALSQKTHPGPVRHLSDCPADEGKLLIGFEKGTVVLWDLKSKTADTRYLSPSNQIIRSISWHYEGKSFIVAHADGYLSIWNRNKAGKETPAQSWAPHSRDLQTKETCRPITHVEWKHGKPGEDFLIFAGGLAMDETGCLPGLTILRGQKSATVLEMEQSIISFISLCHSFYPNQAQEPFAVAVLLKSDFIIVDLDSEGWGELLDKSSIVEIPSGRKYPLETTDYQILKIYPCFENPYPMEIHESACTRCAYYADCPSDLFAAYYSVGVSKQKRQGFVNKQWPISGGELGPLNVTGNQEIVITGHEDGALKFWGASGELQILYKLKTGRHFERPQEIKMQNPYSVQLMSLCLESRALVVAGKGGQITLFKYVKSDTATEIPVLEVPILDGGCDSTNSKRPQQNRKGAGGDGLTRQHSKHSVNSDHSSEDTSEGSGQDYYYPIKARGGPIKRPAGYQPELVCLNPWLNEEEPTEIKCVTLNTAFQLLAYGTEAGLAIVDIGQHVLLRTLSTQSLYGPQVTSKPVKATSIERQQTASEVLHSQPSSSSTVTATNQPPSPHSPNIPSDQTLDKEGGGKASGGTWSVGGGPSSSSQQNQSSNRSSERSKSQGSPYLRKPFTKAQSLAFAADYLAVENNPEKEGSMSRSSSSSSHDGLNANESITSLQFINAYTKKNELEEKSSLWVGTSEGLTVAINMDLPNNHSDRLTEPVRVLNETGRGFRNTGSVLRTAFLDSNFSLLSPPSDSWKDQSSTKNQTFKNKVVARSKISIINQNDEDGSNGQTDGDGGGGAGGKKEMYIVMVTTTQITVSQLPSHGTLYSQKYDVAFVEADIVTLQSSPIVLSVNASNRLQAYSIPCLRLLLDVPLCSSSQPTMKREMVSFGDHGHGIYMCSGSEIQKFTTCAETGDDIRKAAGDLFQGVQMPEREKPSLIGRLFSAPSTSIDRETLFGESSTAKPSRSVAKIIPGPGYEAPEIKGNSAAAEMARARLALQERSQKLSEVEDATERMKDRSSEYAANASKLVEKMKNKKWYEF